MVGGFGGGATGAVKDEREMKRCQSHIQMLCRAVGASVSGPPKKRPDSRGSCVVVVLALFGVFAGEPSVIAAEKESPVSDSNQRPECVTNLDLRLRLGTVDYSIPRFLRPRPDLGKRPVRRAKSIRREICQTQEDPALSAQSVSFTLRRSYGNIRDNPKTPVEARANLIEGTVVRITKHSTRVRTTKTAYDRAVAYINSKGVRLQDLPIEGGFRVFREKKGANYYFPISKKMYSRNGYPIIVDCGTKKRALCNVGPFVNADKSILNYSFWRTDDSKFKRDRYDDMYYKLKDFSKLHEDVINFVDILRVGSQR